MAGGARARALDAFLHGLWIRPAETVLRPLPQGGSNRLGQAAEGAVAGAPSRGAVRRAARERMAPRPHAVDQALSRCGRLSALDRATDGDRVGDVSRLWRWRDLSDGPVATGDRNHGPDRRQALGLLDDERRRPVPGRARVCAGHEGSDLSRRARSAYAGGARMAARLASQAPQGAHVAVPALSHPR